MNPSGNVKKDFKQVKDLAMDSIKIMAHPFATSIYHRKERINKKRNLNLNLESRLFYPKLQLRLHHCVGTV